MATDVNRQLEEMQSGEYVPDNNEQQIQDGLKQPFRMPQFGEAVRQDLSRPFYPGETMRNESVAREAAQAGWKGSRYDTGEYVPGMDVENKRAIEQSGFSKVVNGAAKGGVFAATTAVETVAGVFDGLLEGGLELGRQIINGEQISVPKIVGAGVNNFTARTMADIQRLSEEWFPNYRTEEERSDKYQDEWYKHIFTANFIGDSFLKNFGFTVGAIGGGAVWSKILSAGLRGMAANNLMKGVLAAAEGDKNATDALTTTLKLVQGGAASTIDETAVTKAIANSAKSLNKMSAMHQLFGGVIGAMGEGTLEGVMARNEFLENYGGKLDRDYITAYNALEENLINELAGTDAVRSTISLGPDGQMQMKNELNDKGKAILAERQQQLAERYQNNKKYSEELGDRIAATTFAWNLPILTVSNTIQFGRMLSGGFKSARASVAKVAGDIVKKDGKAVAKVAAKTGNKAGRIAAIAARNGLTEANEEMMQGFVSSGAQRVADARLTAFNDDGYDEETMYSLGTWVNKMLEGGMDYLGDKRNWQEGFLGLMTGLIGIPGRTWNGGIADAVREVSDSERASAEAAAALNARVNSKEFEDMWKGYVRHGKYEREMEDALIKDDEYAWKTASDKQLISDVMMFANAGKLQDLKEIVDMYASLPLVDAENKGVLEAASTEESKKDVANNPELTLEEIHDQANKIKTAIQQYSDMRDAMTAIAPYGTSDAQIQEMIAASMNIKAFESRFLGMFDDVIKNIENEVDIIAEHETEEEAEKLNRVKQIYTNLSRFFTGSDINFSDAIDAASVVQDLRELYDRTDNKEMLKKLDDMDKVANDRKAFIKKLVTLRNLEPAQYNKQVKKPEDVSKKLDTEKAERETEGLNSLVAVKQAYFGKNAKDRSEFLGSLEAVKDTNPAVNDFLKLKNLSDGFKEFMANRLTFAGDITVTPAMVNSAVNDIERRVNSEEEFRTLPDTAFAPKDQFNLENRTAFGVASPTAYDSVKQHLRASMAEYLGLNTETESRNEISPKAVTKQDNPEGTETPEGYDAAAPASAVPEPEVKEQKPQPQEEKKEQQPVEQEPIPATKPQTDGQLMDDEYDTQSVEPEVDEAEDEKQDDKIPYYRTSVPEIDTGEQKKARTAILRKDRDALKQADLSDFVEKHPEYADVWNALNDDNAFYRVATQLKVGDEVKFVINPLFPTYNGQYQILVTDSEGNALTVLSAQTSKYYGLSELRKAIDEEYQKFQEEHPNDEFVFSQTSRVWAKRQGVIEYGPEQSDKNIVDLPGYDVAAPVVFIARGGNAEVVWGGDKNAASKVNGTFNDANENMRLERVGNLYYLAKTDKNKYAPIRLNVEHFKPDTKNLDNPVFNRIRESIGKVADIAQKTNSENLQEQKDKLRDELKTLSGLLNISDIYFELGQYENVGTALRIVNMKNDESTLRRPDQMSAEWLTDFIANFNESIQIRQDKNGKIVGFQEYLDSGLITSNATKLYPKGTDFYFNAWLPNAKEFGPVTQKQYDIMEAADIPVTQSSQKLEEPRDFFGDRDFGFEEVEYRFRKESYERAQKDSNTEGHTDGYSGKPDGKENLAKQNFDSLDKPIQDALLKKGYTKEEFDEMPEALKEQVTKCIGA